MFSLNLISLILIFLGFFSLFISYRKGRILLTIFQLASLVLIYGQCLWISNQFQESSSPRITVGYNEVVYDDAVLVAFLFLIFQILLTLVALNLKKFRFNAEYQGLAKYKINTFAENIILLFVACSIPAAMIYKAGGISFFTNPGSMLAGQTFLLLIAGILKWGLLNRIIFNMNQTPVTIFAFVLYLFVAIFTSRFMTIFALFQVMIFLHYFSNPIRLSSLLKYGVSIFFVIAIFGVYRDIGSTNDIVDFSFAELSIQIIDFSDFFIDWFYTLNAEIFAGVCNAVFEIRSNQSFDFLISELRTLYLFFPNSLKNDPGFIVFYFQEFVENNSAFSSSVVPSGFEMYYFGIGIFGFILYSLILTSFVWFFEIQLSKGRYTNSSIFSIQVVNGLRGSFIGVISFFGIADFLASFVFRCMKSVTKS